MDNLPWLAAESGVFSPAIITLSGEPISFAPYPSRTFTLAAADTNTTFDSGDLLTVLVVKDQTTWALYQHASWVAGTPAIIALSSATRIAEGGTLVDTDQVKVVAITPDPGTQQRAVPATASDTGLIGNWAYDATTGYYYRWVDTDTVVRFVVERTW